MVTNYINGHKIYYDDIDNFWKYTDTHESITIKRPCVKCNHYETKEGHDYCIANLTGVKNACCGHGVEDGYIQFESGHVIRGEFTVETI